MLGMLLARSVRERESDFRIIVGTLAGADTHWTPLDNHGQGLFPEDIDLEDP